MPGPFNTRKPRAGDNWRMPADLAGALMDLSREHRTGNLQPDLQERSAFDDQVVILVKNMTGDPLPRFSVVGLDRPIFDPSVGDAAMAAFQANPGFQVVVPTAPEFVGYYAILLEPLGDQGIGTAAVAGVVPVRLDVQAETDWFADIADGLTTCLRTGAEGTAKILWKQPGKGPLWGIVQLGGSLPSVRWGVLAADWDINLRPNYVTVNPCNQDGSGIDAGTTVKVFLYWPDTGPHLQPTRVLLEDDLLPYLPIGSAGDGTPQGAALPIGLWPVFGKVKEDWVDGHNYVTVRLCDEDGTEFGYAADVKCWLYSPENLANVKGVKLVAGDLIRIETPKYDAGTGVVIAHAINAYAGGDKNKLLDNGNHTDTVQHNAVKGDIIFSSANGTWNALPIQADNSILTAWGGIPDWFGAGAPFSILSVDGMGDLAWLGPGNDGDVLTTTLAGVSWQPPATATGLNTQITVLTGIELTPAGLSVTNVTLDFQKGVLVGVDTNPPIVIDGTDCSE